jgi:AcrR family transcriptional regulator
LPRTYRLGERAAAMESTRARILEAAVALYIERGISATTMRDVGQRADVAPGTLRNHFRSRELLDQAMVERLRAEAPLPPLDLIDSTAPVDERLRQLFRAAGEFFQEAAPMYRMWLREPMLTGPWQAAGAAYGERWDELMGCTLGPLADHADAIAVLRAVVHPTVFAQLGRDGRSIDEVAQLLTNVVSPWFAAREVSAVESRE